MCAWKTNHSQFAVFWDTAALFLPQSFQDHLRGLPEKGCLKRPKRKARGGGDSPASLKVTFILTSKPGPVVCLASQREWPCHPSNSPSHLTRISSCATAATVLFHLQGGVINENSFSAVLAQLLQRNVIKLVFLLSFPPPDPLAHPSHPRVVHSSTICWVPGLLQAPWESLEQGGSPRAPLPRGEAPGGDIWAWSLQLLPPASLTCPVFSPELPGLPCNNTQQHSHKPARGLAHAGMESVSLITSALMSISPLLWSCPWHAEERKIWLLSEAHLTPLPRNGTLSVSGFHGWMNGITAVLSSLKIKGRPSPYFRPIGKLMHLMSDLNGNRTWYYYFYKTNTSSS